MYKCDDYRKIEKLEKLREILHNHQMEMPIIEKRIELLEASLEIVVCKCCGNPLDRCYCYCECC